MSALAQRTHAQVAQNVVWEPQTKQALLIECPVFEVLFGGARGGGKSDGILGDFAVHAQLFGIDAIGLVVRRTFTELLELIERSRAIYQPIGAQYKTDSKQWRFPNGARLRFAYLESMSRKWETLLIPSRFSSLWLASDLPIPMSSWAFEPLRTPAALAICGSNVGISTHRPEAA
jgi:hypothetical protein